MTARYPRPAILSEMPPQGHFAIEASAGTGKTYLIEHRVVDLLLRGGARIEEILVVTFTEKATAELKTRIRALLRRILDETAKGDDVGEPSDPHWVIDDDARTVLETALIAFDRVAISTIHGFCHQLVGDHAFAGGRQLRQEQIADISAFESAFRSELREHFAVAAEESEYLDAWLGLGYPVATLENSLYSYLRANAPPARRFDAEAFASAVERGRRVLASLRNGDPAAELKRRKVHHSTARVVLDLLDRLVEVTSAGSIPKALAALAGLELESTKREKAVAVLVDLDPAIADLVSAPPLASVVTERFAECVRERLRRDKHEHGLFDFDDMLGQLWATLCGPGGGALAADLRQRHRFALIDEFQDTDEIQWNIFRRIYLEGEGGFLSIIGDPKQAIYSFRGADVYTYLRAVRELQAAGGRLIRLETNFRSTPAMVSAYNDLFESGFFSEGIEYSPVSAGAKRIATSDGRDVLPFRVLCPEPDADASMGELRAGLLEAIVADIEAVLTDTRPLRVGEPGRQEAVKAREIFVLTRSSQEALEVANRLRERSIPCALYQQEGLLTSDECGQLRDLLAAIANPRDRSARLRAWLTPFFGLDLEELSGIAEVDDTHALVARLYDWKQLADHLDYEELFASILEHSGVVERELWLAPSERALTNIEHLIELLLADVIQSRCDIHELLLRLDRWRAEAELIPGQDRNLQRLETDSSSVQIMTVHKSKGLEAELVYLYGGFSSPPSRSLAVYHQDGERRLHVGRLVGEAKERVTAEAAAEDQRLLYVAVTRAVSQVVLPHIPQGALPRSGGYYQALNERLGLLLSAQHPGYEAVIPETASAADSGIQNEGPPPVVAVGSARWDPSRVPRGRRRFEITSYTRLKHAAEIEDRQLVVDQDLDVAEETGRILSEDDLPGGAESGILVHELLEDLDLAAVASATDHEAWCELPGPRRAIETALERNGLPDRYLPSVQRMVWNAVSTPLTTSALALPRVRDCVRTRTEVEFIYPIPEPRGGFVRGFIDLVFEAGGLVYALDWKTDVLADYGPDAVAAHVAENYQLQLELYSTALARALPDTASFGGLVYAFVRGMDPQHPGRGVFGQRLDGGEIERRYRALAQGLP